MARDNVKADGRQREANADRENRFGNIISTEPNEGRKGEQHQRENLGIAEIQCDRCEQRSKSGEKEVRNWPFSAIGLPSNVVATAVEAPGIPSVIEEIAPPYIAP